MGAQRAAAKSHRGGLIPDLVILRFYLPSSDGLPVTRTYDVKTVGHSEKYCRASIARGRAADIRAAEVPVDYETKARKVDAEYNGWPYQRGGPPGPVLTLLRSLPPASALASPASSRATLGSSFRQLQTARPAAAISRRWVNHRAVPLPLLPGEKT